MTWTKESDLDNKDSWIGEYWIGLRKASDGKWKWDHESGESLQQNSDLAYGGKPWWKTGEPNNANGKEDCAAVGFGGSEVTDDDCDAKKPVLCVKRIRKLFHQVSTVVELLQLRLGGRGNQQTN